MTFAEKLNILMNIYRLPNIAVARGLGVDPSLISRWKTGRREPADERETTDALADFLSCVSLLSHDRAQLAQTLGVSRIDTPERLSAALRRWLGDAEATESDGRSASDPVLWDGILGLFSQSGTFSPPGPINLWPRVQKGKPANHETFPGADGCRQAAVNFMHLVLSGGRPAPVSLLLPGDIQWITEDAAFSVLWEKSLRALVNQGCPVTMIHSTPSDADALLKHLRIHWPLLETGRFLSLGLPAAMKTPDKPVIFVSPGRAAMVSYFFGGSRQNAATLLFQNAADASLYDGLFKAFARQSTTLAEPISEADFADAPRFDRRAFVAYTGRPSALWLPPDLLARLAPHLLDAREAFFSYLEGGGQWTELWRDSLFDLPASGADTPISLRFSADLWGGSSILTVPESETPMCLAYMSGLLHKYNGLNAAAIPGLPNRLRFHQTEDGTFLFRPGDDGRCFALRDPDGGSMLETHLTATVQNAAPMLPQLARALQGMRRKG